MGVKSFGVKTQRFMCGHVGRFPKLGLFFGKVPSPYSPYKKDHSILGSILGSPYFGKLPCSARASREKSGIYVHLEESSRVQHSYG